MDQAILVDDRFDDGERLVTLLGGAGFEVTAAFWIKTREEGLWHLYIASPSVSAGKVGKAYGTVYSCLSRIPGASVDMSEVKLVPTSDPTVKQVLALRNRHRAPLPIRIGAERLGDLLIQEAYIYPPSRPMEVLARGKEEVLRHLEAESQARVGKPGEYLLARDETGGLVAVIAGRSFIGTGTMPMGGARLDVVDGIVTGVEPG